MCKEKDVSEEEVSGESEEPESEPIKMPTEARVLGIFQDVNEQKSEEIVYALHAPSSGKYNHPYSWTW